MTFVSPTFLVFLLIVLVWYGVLERRGQNWLLLAASLVFYGWWDWRFLGLLLFTAGVDYKVARAIARQRSLTRRRGLLALSLAANLGVLGFFKYWGFLVDSAHAALGAVGVAAPRLALEVILPIGISFYTFQALSYTIDVYRGRLAAIDDALQYFCFITFFPQLVAGPIERAAQLLPQFGRDRRPDTQQKVDGCRQMLWGFFKKMVLADNLAMFVNGPYGDPAGSSGWELAWATYAFAFQIYCDFSGYSDIALGCARLMGFQLMRNFAYPYFAQDIGEFWRRWHISLSTWFRDYLYVVLGGNRGSRARTRFNALAVFTVSGFWHGANWTFLLWGFLHGVFFVASPARVRRTVDGVPGGPGRLPHPVAFVRMAITFHLVCLSWVFFRASSVGVALDILARIGRAVVSGGFRRPPVTLVAWVALVAATDWVGRRHPHPLHLDGWPRPLRWLLYYAIVMAILAWAQLDYVPFIYFQF